MLEGADEDKLRVIFDRINQSGKKLKSFEVFEALNSSASDGRTLRSVSDAVARSTNFGLISEDQVLNVLKLVGIQTTFAMCAMSLETSDGGSAIFRTKIATPHSRRVRNAF